MGQGVYRRGVRWPIVTVGSIAACLFILSIVPPYFEIRKRRGRVVGISKDYQRLTSLALPQLLTLLQILYSWHLTRLVRFYLCLLCLYHIKHDIIDIIIIGCTLLIVCSGPGTF